MFLQTRIGGRAPRQAEVLQQGHDMDNAIADHYMNCHSVMSRAETVWKDHAVAHMPFAVSLRSSPKDLQVVLKAARASQLRNPFVHQLCKHVLNGSTVTMKCYPSTGKGNEWLSSFKSLVNAKQFEVISVVANKVLLEFADLQSYGHVKSDPLLYFMAGKPGVGKSFVLHQIKQFSGDVIGCRMGQQIAFAALQAVMAVHVGGETLYHVAGINPFLAERGSGTQIAFAQKESLAVRMLFLR